MQLRHPARFHDGETAASRPASVTLTAQGIRIDETESSRFHLWRYEDLKSPEAIPGVDAFRLSTRLDEDAQLVIESARFAEDLARVAPDVVSKRGRVRRIGKEAALAIALVAGLGLALFIGIPSLAHVGARMMPVGWDDALGKGFEDHFLFQGARCQAAAGRRALDKMVGRLRPAFEWDRPLSIAVADNGIVNAFAAPGGRVVLLRGLIEKAEAPEEVAGVLAHELGHVVKYHPTENFIRIMGITTLIDLVLGDGAAMLEALGEAGGWLLLLSHGREAESEADVEAVRMMAEVGIDPAGLARFFARLGEEAKGEDEAADKPGAGKKQKEEEGGLGSLLAYLSTHPPLAERERRAAEAHVVNTRPVLSAAEWRDLKAICGEKTENGKGSGDERAK